MISQKYLYNTWRVEDINGVPFTDYVPRAIYQKFLRDNASTEKHLKYMKYVFLRKDSSKESWERRMKISLNEYRYSEDVLKLAKIGEVDDFSDIK